MTFDILDVLRAPARRIPPGPSSPDDLAMLPQSIVTEAADEIERLRSRISHLEAHRDSLMAIVARQALELE